MDDTPRSVHQAIAAVMADLPNIGKGDKSPEGYAYRGVEAVTRHLQPLLARHGVVIVPDAHIVGTVPSPAMKDGWQDVIMHVDWTVYGPDGSSIKASTNGVGRDRSDKGANKAQTQAFKYLVLHLFCIADGKDDSDSHTYEADRADPNLAPVGVIESLISRMNALPGVPERAAVKKAFVARFGKPDQLKSADVVAADALVSEHEIAGGGGEAPGAPPADGAETADSPAAPLPTAPNGQETDQ